MISESPNSGDSLEYTLLGGEGGGAGNGDATKKETDTYGLRKVFPENADMPGSVEAAAAEGVGGIPRNNVATDIRRAAAAADNQRLQGHPRRPHCQAARLPHRTLDSHSIAWKEIFPYGSTIDECR